MINLRYFKHRNHHGQFLKRDDTLEVIKKTECIACLVDKDVLDEIQENLVNTNFNSSENANTSKKMNANN